MGQRTRVDDKNKLYVGNLPYTMNDESLGQLFAEFGEVVEAKVIADKFSGRSKGFGFVTMGDEDSAKKAIEAMNGKDVGGRNVVVNVSRPKEKR
ncbi:MAG: RNA-binding protein [Patescibacteria group bacterium]|jgi:RNA recognition motif-containing protein|nr:RNA-binding protein [Patescibacteria group bacterium]